jgi:hypothetical protein
MIIQGGDRGEIATFQSNIRCQLVRQPELGR